VGIIKKLVQNLLVLIGIVIISCPLWIKSVPPKYFSALTGKSSIIDKYVCDFSAEVVGESMSPVITPKTRISLSRCFEETDLTEGTVVLFDDGSYLRYGIIRHVIPLTPIVYKVSDEKAPELFHDVTKKEIAGMTKSIDISQSKYQAKQEVESFILDPSEFLTDLYLGKIPKGMGIEMTTVEKTTSFSRRQDKFCSVIVPKEDLLDVSTEFIDAKTEEILISKKNIVFNVRPEPNINCKDFGSFQGMLNLDPGTYRYRFLLNHQVLADIKFEVR